MGVNCTDRHGLFKLMGWAWIFVFLSSCAAKIQGWSLVSSSMPGPVLTSLESAPGKPQNSDKHFTGFDLSLVLSAPGRFPHSPRADSLAAPGTHPTAPTQQLSPDPPTSGFQVLLSSLPSPSTSQGQEAIVVPPSHLPELWEGTWLYCPGHMEDEF